MQDDSNKKNPRVAGILALVGGPVGFLYVGWRYALAATVVFLSFMLVFAFLLFVPPWLKYVNLPAFAVIAYRICERLNGLVDRGQHRAVLNADTWPVAAFAMTSMLPLLAGVHSAVMGVTTAVSPFMGGDVGRGLFMLLLVTPIFVAVNFVGFALIATLIDRVVMRSAPAARRHIFPPVVSFEEET